MRIIREYHELGLGNEVQKQHTRRHYQMLNKLDSLGDILDIGCGKGYGLQATDISRVKSLTGVDVNGKYLEVARKRYKDGRFITMDISNGLKFPDNSFDTICCFEVIEHIEPKKAMGFLQEMARVLRPNGVAVLSTPNASMGLFSKIDGGNPFHLKEYTFSEIHSMVAPYFEVTSVKHHFSTRLNLPFLKYIGKIYEGIIPSRFGLDLIFFLRSRKRGRYV